MLRSIWFFIKFAVSLIGTIPALKRAGKMEEAEQWKYSAKIVAAWAGGRLKSAGVEVEVIGAENITGEPTIFVGNHSSFFDIPACIAAIPGEKAFISKIENKNYPIISKWMEYMGCKFIDRSDIRQQIRQIGETGKNLQKGMSYFLFPEGTRTMDGKLAEYKAGSFKFATKHLVQVQPFAIIGARDVMQKGSMIVRPGKIQVIFGKAVQTTKEMNSETQQLADSMHAQVAELMSGGAGSTAPTGDTGRTGEV